MGLPFLQRRVQLFQAYERIQTDRGSQHFRKMATDLGRVTIEMESEFTSTLPDVKQLRSIAKGTKSITTTTHKVGLPTFIACQPRPLWLVTYTAQELLPSSIRQTGELLLRLTPTTILTMS